ncbi:MAG: DUF4317 family protein [Firmicutes bacterium]|nr:DUF4317 family protein [Bacillota bacterium]
MNKKEIAEIKKQFIPNRTAVRKIAGCIIKEKEIVSTFKKDLYLYSEEEIANYMGMFQKALSGKIGKTLINLEFPTKENHPEQKELLILRNSALNDDEALFFYYEKTHANYRTEDNYLILVADGEYDIPSSKDSGFEDSESTYHYLITLLCPLTLDKESLSYNTALGQVEYHLRDWIIGNPEKAFLYPAFNDRGEDIHSMLYYSKKANDLSEDFLERMFAVTYLPDAETQKKVFDMALEEAGVTFENAVQFREIMQDIWLEENEETTDDEMLRKICERSGMQTDNFAKIMQEQGIKALYSKNLVNEKTAQIQTDDIDIKVPIVLLRLISVRRIDGQNCIVIKPNGCIRMDGVELHI